MILFRKVDIFAFLLIHFLSVFSIIGLVKVDVANNIVGGNANYTMSNSVRPTIMQDIADAGVDARDLLNVLRGIALPLLAVNGIPGNANSWLHLPRTMPNGRQENLETHLLRGHGPSGGLSQAHIMTDSVFSSGVVNGIQVPKGGVGLSVDPNLPLVRGGVFGNGGNPVNQDWDQLQKNANSVNIPIRNTVVGIIASINIRNQVNFQVAPIRGMRKFIIDLNQGSLANCPRPIIYDDQTPFPATIPPLSEGWLRKIGGNTRWRVAQRPRFLIINLPERDARQVDVGLAALGENLAIPVANPILLQQQASAAVTLNPVAGVDNFGREKQSVPMTIYFGR